MTRSFFSAVAVLSLSAGIFAEAPVNAWELKLRTGPNITWENGIAYDPATRQVAWYGGHAWGYPQSNYTHIYDIAKNQWRDSNAPLRPQRRCLVMLNYLDSCGRMICTQGGSGHGAIQEGTIGGDYTRVIKNDPRGPWLYDMKADRWENCRTLAPIWRREAHAQCAYDPTTDALVWLTSLDVTPPAGSATTKPERVAKLGLYCPRTNRVSYRDLPKELHGRLAYGIAADPVLGKVVLFGGCGPGGWVWVPGDKADAYNKFVHNDTWMYDVATDKWKQCRPKTVPPRGMPLHDHRFIVMTYHNPSGTIIMQQQPIDKYDPDTANWPATQFWSFDVASEQWTLLPLKDCPPMMGLLTYATHEDLLILVGGGHDGKVTGDDGKVGYRASLSGQLWTCRVEVPGKKGPAKPIKLATSEQPWRPGGLAASVEGNKKVVLRWNENREKDLVGYNLYCAVGKEVEGGKGKALNAKPIAETSFTDESNDLSDKIVRSYWVTAVNKAGVESGPSPLAYTFPDPPLALAAKVSADKNGIVVSWDWPKDLKVAGFNVYHVNNHMNTHGEPAAKVKAWYDSWKPIADKPIEGRSATFTIPAGDTAKHHYFFVRALNVLGQEGFYTDIVSATDKRFKP